ncbi:MAG TPA: asparagine synthase (glutamine-hydrolyzing) [Pyrinomonadaceae bacterium]|nr:asparagine synthase (glutamine-hydrolyzing) [Pyrinomonadaceae bacterium]
MSGIVAIFYPDNRPVSERLLGKALDTLVHRGRDGRGIWIGGNVGLGHRMRWTTPESLNEGLPLQKAEGRLVITCDARIDNREDLLRQLSFDRTPVSTITDSEIVLRAYEKWGEDCTRHLIGDFVFAIWDATKKMLFCARDTLGLKHFYYYYRPGVIFALASEIKALLQIEQVPKELNEAHLADYLILRSEDKVSTFYKGIDRLPSNHSLRVTSAGMKISQSWAPRFSELKLRRDADYQEAFLEKFSQAVNCRLRSAFPIGAMLSGGLDSSAVVCVADRSLRSQNRDPLNTYSAIFPTLAKMDPRIDESAYMKAIIEKTKVNPHFVNVDDASPLQNMDKIVWHTDHPVGYLNVYMDSQIFKRCEADGVRSLLTGHDGDTTVTYGYQEFEQLAKRGKFIRMMREARAMSKNIPSRMHSVKRLAWHKGLKPAIPAAIVKAWRFARFWKESIVDDSVISHPLHLSSVNSEFRSREELVRRTDALWEENSQNGATPAQHHWNSLTTGLFSNMHEQVEKLSAAYGVEPRHPFFDRRLIEFCVSLPPGQRIYKGWTRSIFRFAMEGILPEAVQWRVDKANLGAHIKMNLLKYGSDEIEAAIGRDSWMIAKFLDTDQLRSAYDEFKLDANRKDPEALLLLTSMYLIKWLDHSGFAQEDHRVALAGA